MSKTTLSHAKSVIYTREQLDDIPNPVVTATHYPIPHHQFVNEMEKALNKQGIEIREASFALNGKLMKLFGVMKVTLFRDSEMESAIGFRHSNDKSISLQLCAGASVFVCDNMMFRGDIVTMKRKHTLGLSGDGLARELYDAIGRVKNESRLLQSEISWMKEAELSDDMARQIIYDVFSKKIMPARFFTQVNDYYFKAPSDQIKDRTMWSLHNAHTQYIHQMAPDPAFKATVRLGGAFERSPYAPSRQKAIDVDSKLILV